MGVEWADSADRHGVPRPDALHAISRASWHVSAFEPSRIPGGVDPDGWIGPDRSGQELEVFAEVTPGPNVFIFHVMPVREKTRRLFQAVLDRRKR